MLNLLNIVRISGTGGGTGWMVSDSDDTADHPNDPPSPHCAAQTSSFSYFSSISFSFSYFSHKHARFGKEKCCWYFGPEEFIPSKCFCHCYFHCHWPCHCHLEHHRHPLETVSAPGLFNSSAVSGEPSCCERRHHANKISRLPPFSLFYI